MSILHFIKDFSNTKNINKLSSALFILLCVFYFSIRITLIFSTNTELMNGETNNVWNILNVLEGRSLYMNPEEAPYEIFQYTPIAQLCYTGISAIVGNQNYLDIFLIVRAFVLLINILLAIFFYKVLRTYFDVTKQHSIWLSFLSLLLLTPQNWIIRPDGIATSLSVIAVGFSIIALISKNNKHFIYSGILTSISFFAKQDAIQLFVILPIALLLIQEYKAIFLYLSSLIVSFALLFAIFYFVFGDIFLQSIIGGVNNEISLVNVFSVLNRYVQIYGVFPFVLILLAAYSVIKQSSNITVYISLVVIGTFLFGAAASLKLGAWINYYTLPSLLGIFLFALYVKDISNLLTAKYVYVLFGFYFFTGIVFHFASAGFTFSKQEYNSTKKIAEEIRNAILPETYIYTTDRNLKLQLFDRTIFPNCEIYGIVKFDYASFNKIQSQSIYITKNDTFDYVYNHIFDNNKIKEKKLFKDYLIISYSE